MRHSPKLPVLVAISLWSFGPLLQKLISESSQFLLLAVAFACGFTTFSVILLIRYGRRALQQWRHFRPIYMLMGLCGYFGYMIGINQSFRSFGSAAGTTMLNYTWPVFTVVFAEAIFRRTHKPWRIRALEVIGTGLGFLAVLVLATKGDLLAFHFANARGLAFGLMGGALYGFFSAYSGTVPAEAHNIFLLTAIGTSFLAMLPLAWTERALLTELPARAFLYAAGQGVLMNGLGFFFWTTAVRMAREQDMPVTSVTSLIFFLPLSSVAVISLALGEREIVSPYFLVTLVLLLAGLALCQNTERVARMVGARKARRGNPT